MRPRPPRRPASTASPWPRARGKEQSFADGDNALRARPKDEEATKDEQIVKLQRKVGELVLDIGILKEANKGRPFEEETCDE